MRLLSDACGGDHQGDEPQVQKQQVQIPKVTIKALERKVDEPITLMQHRAVQFNEVHYDESISASTTKVPQLQSDIEAAEASKVHLQEDLAKHQADRTAAKASMAEATAIRGKKRRRSVPWRRKPART